MAFIVEDGTGKKGATSYATVAYFKAYWLDRGITITWADAAIQANLVAATSYIDTAKGPSFKGSREFSLLLSRSMLTLTALPTDGDTVTVDSDVYTFRDSPTLTNDVEIGDTVPDTLANLAEVVAEVDTNDVVDSFLIPDPDVWSMAIYFTRDGIATTATGTVASFDVASSTGYSGRRQPLEFPREDLYDRQGELVSGMPDLLKQATCEYAYRAYSAALAPDPSVTNNVLSVSKTVGPIATATSYASGQASVPKPYPAADRLLADYLKDSGTGIIRA